MTAEEIETLPDTPPALGSLDDIDYFAMLAEMRLASPAAMLLSVSGPCSIPKDS